MRTNEGIAVHLPVRIRFDLAAALVLLALAGLDDRLRHDAPDERVAHVGNRGGAVESALALHLRDDVLDRLHLVGLEVERLADLLVALDELVGGKAQRNPGRLGMVLHQVHDAVEAAVHGPAVVVDVAEVLAAGPLLIVRDVNRVLDELVDALVAYRGDGDDRNAQDLLELVDPDGTAVALHLVHHVEREHHGYAELHELHREVEIALDVGRVDDVDDALRLFLEDVAPRDNLFAGVRRHRVDAGKVHDVGVGMPFDRAALAVDRHAREVAHVLVGARELVEQRRLAAVLVARQRKVQHGVFGERLCLVFPMEPAALSQAGVVDLEARVVGVERGDMAARLGGAERLDLDALRVVDAQRELVAVDRELHGVAHGRVFLERDDRAGDDAHVEEVLPKRAFSPNGPDLCRIAELEGAQQNGCTVLTHIVCEPSQLASRAFSIA